MKHVEHTVIHRFKRSLQHCTAAGKLEGRNSCPQKLLSDVFSTDLQPGFFVCIIPLHPLMPSVLAADSKGSL